MSLTIFVFSNTLLVFHGGNKQCHFNYAG